MREEMAVFFSAVIFLSCIGRQTQASEQQKILGIFSSCLGNNGVMSTNETYKEIYRSRTVQRLTHFLFTRDCLIPNYCPDNFTTWYEYTEYDVCYDKTLLVEIATSLELDLSYNNFDSKVSKTNIVTIVSYLNQELFDLFCAITLLKPKNNPLILIFKDDVIFPHAYNRNQHPIAAYKRHTSMLDTISLLGWKNFGFVLISLDDNNEIYAEQYKNIINEVKALGNVCYFHQIVTNEQEFRETALKIQNEDYDIPKILYGTTQNQFRFMKETEATWFYRHKWVLRDVRANMFTTLLQTHGLQKQSFVLISDKQLKARKYFARYRNLYPSIEDLELPAVELSKFFGSEIRLLFERSLVTLAIVKTKLIRKKDQPAFNPKIIFKKFAETKLYVYALEAMYPGINSVKELISNKSVKNILFDSNCPYVMCGPGRYKIFSMRNQTKWDKAYGQICIQCPKNHVKPSTGDALCNPCTSFYIANDQYTHCYDPYIDVFLNFDVFTVKICTVTSLFLVLMVIIVMLVFIVYRKTPLVNAIDLKVSMLHLFLLLMQVLTPCYFFLGKPHFLRCVSLPISICIFNTITISIVLVKSQKLLAAFQSKIKLTHKETRKTIGKQAATVVVNVFIALSIIVVSFYGKWPNVTSERFQKSTEKLLVCNTHLHATIQLIFQIFLQVACFVPAFRGRKLPNVFNEAMTVVYACFTMTITLLVMLPIQFFQKDVRDKQLVVFVTMLCNICEQFILMYGKKMYILVFKPKKNTKQYFQKQTFEAMIIKSSRKIL